MKKNAFVSLMLVIALLLSACGSASSESYTSTSDSYEYAAEEAAYEGGAGEMAYEDVMAEEDVSSTDSKEGADLPSQEGTTSEEKLVYTCSMRVQTLAYEETMSSVRATIKAHQGIIESEETTDEDYSWYSVDGKTRGTLRTYLTVRVPSAQYETFLKEIEGSGGKTLSKSMTVENITTAYNDQSIRIEALETQEERLMEMMKKADTVEDMIYVEQRLSDVQTELNQARSRLSQMDTDVAYSTVHLTIEEVIQYTKVAYEKNFFERTAEAFSDSFSNFLRVMEGLLHLVIYLLPFALVAGVIIAIVLWLTRKQRAVRREEKKIRKAEKKAMKEQQKAAKRAMKEQQEAAKQARAAAKQQAEEQKTNDL